MSHADLLAQRAALQRAVRADDVRMAFAVRQWKASMPQRWLFSPRSGRRAMMVAVIARPFLLLVAGFVVGVLAARHPRFAPKRTTWFPRSLP